MNKYHLSGEDKQFLAQYHVERYERPSVATDMAIFSIMEEGEQDNFRKLPPKALKLLLIQRSSCPFKNKWALPGGFCKSNEDVYNTARRELYEETGIQNAYLNLAGIYGEVGRDPRGWIISHTFLALVDGERCRLQADTDAKAAQWFALRVEAKEHKRHTDENAAYIETDYELHLENEKSGVKLYAKVREYKQFAEYHETVTYEIMECEGLAFDHAKIILQTLLGLRKNARNEIQIVFDLMPEFFTLTQLQNAFELVLGQNLLAANFRRKINDYVIETEQIIEGAGHRPAKLFKRNVEAFYR
ncbi:MAG: NUDIX hydrolase [Lachnospiraceae bacterium]|nr:NUDIX hydrolase [Lachnospiraceae bacterium]